jgi:methylglutaconyl-CoA hydratase
MNRPDVRNAFNAELIAALRDAFTALSADDGVRSIVLAGEGKTFSGGADIGWMRAALELSEAENVRDAEAMAAMLIAIDRCPKPVIARVQGAALGGGCGLVAAADIVVAADDALFGFTEVKLGIIPAVISPFVLPKIGQSQARALFVTGERFSAEYAQRIGLVHHVVPASELDARIAAIVAEFRTAAPSAIAAAKAVVRNVSAATPDEATKLSARAIAKQRTTPEGQEGLRAFLERRPASWHDT